MATLHYIVELQDRRSGQLAGRDGTTYESPPHDLQHAYALASALLDVDPGQLAGQGPWRRAIAGGERTVTLTLADRLFDPQVA